MVSQASGGPFISRQLESLRSLEDALRFVVVVVFGLFALRVKHSAQTFSQLSGGGRICMRKAPNGRQ